LEKYIEIFVLMVCSVPVLRFAGKRPVRRELRENPGYAAVALAMLGLAAGCAVWSCLRFPNALRASASVALVLAVATYVRARPGYGRSRGLPPGSLGLTASIDSIFDEGYYARQAKMWGPVFKMSQMHRPVVCIADLKTGFEFLEASKDRLRQSALPFSRLIPGGYIEFMNAEQHERFRGILRPPLISPVIDESEPYVAERVREVLGALERNSDERGATPEQLLDEIVFASLLRLFFGITVDDERFERFRELYKRVDFRAASYTSVGRELADAFARVSSEVASLVEWIRVAPPEQGERSVLSEILRTLPAGDEEALETVSGNLIFMLAVARDDLEGFLSWLLKMTCDHPRTAAELRAAASAAAADRTQLDRLAVEIVKETLRLRQSEYIYRDVLADCSLGKYRIPKGWKVRLCLTECHRSESVFPDPHQFKPGRFAESAFTKFEYRPFSDGAHACIGMRLANMVGQTFLRELAAGFEWGKTADSPVQRGNRQWHHWTPGVDFRVSVISRPADGSGASSNV
jgi:cytochrome P450